MVSKYVLHLSSETNTDYDSELSSTNKNLQHILTDYKNKITEHYKNKSWDKYKKLTNEYEVIFTTPNKGTNICTYTPVSRSFFKMWEILHDFADELKLNSTTLNAIFLAEGPGGFAEAFAKYRNNNTDKYYAISLKSNNKSIPDWKYKYRLNICYGEDGTGDLYNISNIKYLKNTLPQMDIITADGGFDFSNNFNNQEELSLRLILCEFYAALKLQKKGGHFILKIYDIFHEYTIKTLCMLKKQYDHIYIVKPLSSRPANSEKYVVCINFLNQDAPNLETLLTDYTEENLSKFFDTIPIDNYVLHNIVAYNIYYTIRQIFYIDQTIKYIEKNFYDKDIIEHHKMKAIKWCKKYRLQYSIF